MAFKVKISVLVPTFNRRDYLDQALRSILKQTVRPYEVIIVDNASTDSTPDVIKKYPSFTYVRNRKNIGLIGNLNKCLRLASGDYISFLHSDDLIAPDWYEQWSRVIRRHRAKYYISPYVAVDSRSKPLYARRSYPTSALLRQPNVIGKLLAKYTVPHYAPTAAIIYDRSIFKDIGKFDEHYKTEADVMHSLKILSKYDVYYYNKILFANRHHATQGFDKDQKKTTQVEEIRRMDNYFKILKKFSQDSLDPGFASYFIRLTYFMRLAYINMYILKGQWQRVRSYFAIARKNQPGVLKDWLDWLLLFKVQMHLFRRALFHYRLSAQDRKQLAWLNQI